MSSHDEKKNEISAVKEIAEQAWLMSAITIGIAVGALIVALLALFRDSVIRQEANPSITVDNGPTEGELRDDRIRDRENLPPRETDATSTE